MICIISILWIVDTLFSNLVLLDITFYITVISKWSCIVILICISLINREIEYASIFIGHLYFPFCELHNLFLLHIFPWGYLFISDFKEDLYIFWRLIHMYYKKLLMVCGLSFQSHSSIFWLTEVLNFNVVEFLTLLEKWVEFSVCK